MVRNGKKIIAKKFLFVFLIVLVSPLLAYGGEAFDIISFAIANKASKVHLQELVKKYKGVRLEGKAYVVSVNTDIEGETMVNLATEKDLFSSKYVSIIVFTRDYFAERARKLKPGRYVRFFGEFDEIRMRTVVIREGIVK